MFSAIVVYGQEKGRLIEQLAVSFGSNTNEGTLVAYRYVIRHLQIGTCLDFFFKDWVAGLALQQCNCGLYLPVCKQ